MVKWKYAAGSWVVGSQRDRFVDYKPNISLPEKIARLASIEEIKGIEIIYPYDNINVSEVKEALEKYDLTVVSVLASGINDYIFRLGALISPDAVLRQRVIREIQGAVEVARALNCSTVTLWPGQDGFDYPFQLDYRQSWGNLVSILREITSDAPDIFFCLEYKPREPRIFSTVDNLAKALLLCETLQAPNLGIALDFAHSLLAQENPAEAAALANYYGRLKHIHVNDCFGKWDDDLVVGSVHFWQTVEFFWLLQEMDYQGWITLDISPYREDALEAARVSLSLILDIADVLSRVDREALKEAQKTANALEAAKIFRKALWA